MDRERWRRVWALFEEALELPPDGRAAFLGRSCAGDDALRREVAGLLEHSGGTGEFLGGNAARFAGPALEPGPLPDPVTPDEHLGPYRILRRVAVGGMSEVHLAERVDGQFRQEVAIKFLAHAPGAPEEAARRFEAERRILGALDHPGIARILDGGVTRAGRPYLVMEYVDGKPLTEACRGLGVRARLERFATVCDAVAHAHRRMVVHRDLKPANILVRDDGTVKLLDFGIAKLLGDAAGDSPATRTGFRLLTPEYAAPEQVRGEPVTAATDVYALGVLLYELLTGTRPFDVTGLPPSRLERLLTRETPVRPSTRLRATGAAGPVSPRRLRGDLDVIVLRALRPEPEARYASPADLAGDLRRHLEGFPIAARASSPAYRTRRWLRRHRILAAAAAAGVLFAGFHVVQVTGERNRARVEAAKSAEIAAFLTGLFAVSDPDSSLGNTIPARTLLDRARERIRGELGGQPDVQASLQLVIAVVYRRLGLYDEALPLVEETVALRRARGDDAGIAEALDELGRLRFERGDYPAARESLEEALRLRRESLGDDDPRTADTLDHLAEVLREQTEFDAAEALYREALDIRRARFGAAGPQVAGSQASLGELHRDRGDYAEAERLFAESLRLRRAHFGPRHTEVAAALLNLGDAVQNRGRYAEADSLLGAAVALYRELLGPDHPQVATAMNSLGVEQFRSGDFAAAEPTLREALAIRRRSLGEDHPLVAKSVNDLAALYRDREDYASAEPLFREALGMYRDRLGPDHASIPILQANLGAALWGLERYAEAESLFRAAVAGYVEHFGPESSYAVSGRIGLAMVLHERGRLAEAEAEYAAARSAAATALPADHPLVGHALLGEGRLYAATGREAEAEPLLQEAAGIFASKMGGDHTFTARSRVALAGCLQSTDPSLADSLVASALDTYRGKLPGDHRLVREALLVGIAACRADGNGARAEDYRAALAERRIP